MVQVKVNETFTTGSIISYTCKMNNSHSEVAYYSVCTEELLRQMDSRSTQFHMREY